MVKPITISAVIILSHISLKMFDLIFAMTGPDNAETGHPALNMYLTTFRANDFAKGAAIAIILFLIALKMVFPVKRAAWASDELQGEPLLAHGREMRAARDERDIVPGRRESRAEIAADGARRQGDARQQLHIVGRHAERPAGGFFDQGQGGHGDFGVGDRQAR